MIYMYKPCLIRVNWPIIHIFFPFYTFVPKPQYVTTAIDFLQHYSWRTIGEQLTILLLLLLNEQRN